MNAEEQLRRARIVYDRAVYDGDPGALADAERGLDAVEADTALARGRLLHARFVNDRGSTGAPATEDPAELPLFERAAELYRSLGDTRGEADGLFWIGCLHQVVRRDDETAVPFLERSRRLAAEAGDKPIEAEALRHLGIAAHRAGRLDQARDLLEHSSRLRREAGLLPGVASNMVGLAYVAAAQGRRDDAHATHDAAEEIARAQGARAIARHVEQARTAI
jgi:tetratricopeptide (TPR) repeat protein